MMSVGIALTLAEVIGAYLISKGLDKLFENKEDLVKRLGSVIEKSIEEYHLKYPICDKNGKYGFYKSQKIINELLKYRVMKNDYNISDLKNAFDNEKNVLPPDKEQIEKFYDIFITNVNNDKGLKKIEISSTFEEEVFIISNKINEIKRYFENVIAEIDTTLESEWKRQIDVYKNSIREFKPKSALTLLNKLEETIENSGKKSIELSSTIKFLKAKCLSLINLTSDANKNFIEAYLLNKKSNIFREQACYSYYKTSDIDNARAIQETILEFDPYNSIAWSVKILSTDEINLDLLLRNVPKIVIENIQFKLLVYFNTKNNEKYNNQSEIYEKYEIIPSLEKYDNSPVTIDNFKEKLFWFECYLSKYFQGYYYDFNNIAVGDFEILTFLRKITNQFLDSLKDSEIKNDFNLIDYINKFSLFILEGNKDSVYDMKSIYPNLKNKDKIFLLLLANSLQLINEDDLAINLIDIQDIKCIESLYLKAYCFIKKQDYDSYLQTAKDILNLTETVDSNNAENIFNVIYFLYIFGKLNEVNPNEFVAGKSFEFEYYKELIEILFCVIKTNELSTSELLKLEVIGKKLLEYNSKLIFYVAYSYYLLNNYEKCIDLFNKYLNKCIESRDLFYYLQSLYKTKTKTLELVEYLKKWRNNFTFNAILLRIEAELRWQLQDWHECVEICNKYLNEIEDDESFLVLLLVSQNEIEPENLEEILESLASKFRRLEFSRYDYVQVVANILIQRKYFSVALEILYKWATNIHNKQARLDYFIATTNIPPELIEQKETVEIGTFVKYELNGEVFFAEITSNNPITEYLIGKKVSSVVAIKQPLIDKIHSIRILRIMDKFLYLHDEILEEVHSNPYSGIPMQSVVFDDTTPEGIINKLIEYFGPSGTLINEQNEKDFKDYYSYNISFSELSFRCFSLDYIGGYFHLIHQKAGFTQIPSIYYKNFIFKPESVFVIDYTSLIIFHQLSRECEFRPEKKFLISNNIYNKIKKNLKKEIEGDKAEMQLGITMDGVNKTVKPNEIRESNIVYLKSLTKWIDDNCVVKIAASKLDVIRQNAFTNENIEFADYLIDTICLVNENEESILISDDLIFLKYFSISSSKIVSSELFVNSIYDNKEFLFEFVKNKYIGLTIQMQLLIKEFEKKHSEQLNSFGFVISNLSLSLNPNTSNINLSVEFLKYVAINHLISEESFSRLAISVFVNLLRGHKNPNTFFTLKDLIIRNFKLLGHKFDLILKSYTDAIIVLGMN